MLKVSGEALQGRLGSGIDPGIMTAIAREVKPAVEAGVQVAIVVGGACSAGAVVCNFMRLLRSL
jgi:uridylate kinase